MNFTRATKLAGFSLGAVALAVASQVNAGTVTSKGADLILSTDGGLKVVSNDKKNKFQFGGRVQIDYNHADGLFNVENNGEDASDIFFRRVRLFAKGTVNKVWEYKIQYNLAVEDTDDDGDREDGGGTLEDAYIKYKGFKPVTLQAGQFKEPFGLEELTSSKYITTIERSAITNAFAPGRSLGLAAKVVLPNATFTSGFFSEGQDDDDQEDWAWTTRGTFAPIATKTQAVHLGAAYTTREGERVGDQRLGVRIDNGRVGTGQSSSASADIFGLEAAAVFGPLSAQAEYITAEYEDAAADGDDYEVDGFYLLGSFFVTGESRPYSAKKGAFGKIKPKSKSGAIELFARYTDISLEDGGAGDDGEEFTLGANWYANKNVRVSANYIHGEVDDEIASDDGSTTEDDGDAFAFRLQYAF